MFTYLLNLLRYSLVGGEIPKVSESISWEKLYKICKFHQIVPLVGYGLNQIADHIDVPSSIYEQFKTDWKIAVARYTVQKNAEDELIQEFERENIDYSPLKGMVMKEFYPLPELRTMADLDILFRVEQREKVDEILRKLGYKNIQTSSKDMVFIRKPFMNIEMHFKLVDDNTQFARYYNRPWSKVSPLKSNQHLYRFSWEDFYIYMIVHLAKHFKNGGSGIRSIIDLWIFENKVSHLDWEYIEQELKKLEILDFSNHMRTLVQIWFEGRESSNLYDHLTKFIIESGTFGTEENATVIRVATADQKYVGGQFKTWLKQIFLPYQFIKKQYPYLEQYPYLIAIAWIQRIFRIAFMKKGRAREVLSSMTANKNDVNDIQQLFRSIGLTNQK